MRKREQYFSQLQKAVAEYQVPPPPRPVPQFLSESEDDDIDNNPLQRRGSLSSGIRFRSTPIAKMTSTSVQTMPLKKKKESPQYQEIKSPPIAKDPFGTMRASKRVVRNKKDSVELEDLDDVFLPCQKAENADKAKEKAYDLELTLTNELLQLIEDYKTSKISLKEFEIRLEQWRGKAAICDPPLHENKVKMNLS